MAYFDNAATTYPKPESVYAFMESFLQEWEKEQAWNEYTKEKDNR